VLYRPGLAAKAAGQKPLRGTGRPGTAGGSHWCHSLPRFIGGFCQRDNTSAKTPRPSPNTVVSGSVRGAARQLEAAATAHTAER